MASMAVQHQQKDVTGPVRTFDRPSGSLKHDILKVDVLYAICGHAFHVLACCIFQSLSGTHSMLHRLHSWLERGQYAVHKIVGRT